jgi:hypothetical protein
MMGLESSTSDVLSSDAQDVKITEVREENILRGGSLDSSREVDTSEKPEVSANGDAEIDRADVTRNGSLDNARSG